MVFSFTHIALTAAITTVVALLAAVRWLRRAGWVDRVAVAVLAGAAVLVWRLSANLPALNDDGLPGFSANDWAAPVLVFVALSVYADLREPADRRRYRQVRALCTLAALAVNVITI